MARRTRLACVLRPLLRAGAVAFVYWSGGDSSHMPGLPVLVAFRNAFVFNFGSIAFGSFVTVVLWPIRCAPQKGCAQRRCLGALPALPARRWTLARTCQG